MREREKLKDPVQMGVLMIDIKEVAAMCGIGQSTVWKLLKDPASGFPQPIRFTNRCCRWKVEDIKDWCQGLSATPEPMLK